MYYIPVSIDISEDDEVITVTVNVPATQIIQKANKTPAGGDSKTRVTVGGDTRVTVGGDTRKTVGT